MKWKQTFLIVLCMAVLTGCRKQEDISLQSLHQEEQGSSEDIEVTSQEQSTTLYVYVCGHVKEPGVYPLTNGARICDALEQAGGVLEDGNAESLDQAVPVTDGQTIYVPGMEEMQETAGRDKTSEDDGLVDINQADADMLMTLPGIGESKASVIIQYREEHGAFQTIEELMNIPGIKQGVFDKIKNCIKV